LSRKGGRNQRQPADTYNSVLQWDESEGPCFIAEDHGDQEEPEEIVPFSLGGVEAGVRAIVVLGAGQSGGGPDFGRGWRPGQSRHAGTSRENVKQTSARKQGRKISRKGSRELVECSTGSPSGCGDRSMSNFQSTRNGRNHPRKVRKSSLREVRHFFFTRRYQHRRQMKFVFM
jgi:hypothetical protein